MFFIFLYLILSLKEVLIVLSFKTTVELCHPTLHSVTVSFMVSGEWTDTMASNVGQTSPEAACLYHV